MTSIGIAALSVAGLIAGVTYSTRSAAKPTIVLVHGAFADGSSWQHVIPILERDGYTVIAVQNALASLAGDDTSTARAFTRSSPRMCRQWKRA
jgi:hypothetical protein